MPASPPARSVTPVAGRDRFLDLVRAGATVRVVLWHAVGAAAITYVVAAMPAMFFVTGALYARSVDRHGPWHTLVDRLRRIGPPLWLFAGVAWTVMTVAAVRTGTDIDHRHALLWLVPVADPAGSAWEGGWLATPLWYLRTLLWLFLCAPLLIAAVRRAPRLSAAAGLVALVTLDRFERAGGTGPWFLERLGWQLGDLVLYGGFFAFGVCATDGRFEQLRPRHWVKVATAAALGALAWALTQPVPLGVVNNSHPMHLLVGTAWLALALAAAPLLRRVAVHPRVEPVVDYLGQRSLSVYLWHTSAIALALWVLGRGAPLPEVVRLPVYLGLVAALTLAATVLFGWVEDLAARRPPRSWPTASPNRWIPATVTVAAAVSLVATTAAVVGSRVSAGEDVVAFRPPVPSQAPPRPVIDTVPNPDRHGTEVAEMTADLRQLGTALDPDTLHAELDAWLPTTEVPGVVAGIVLGDGRAWYGAAGTDAEGHPRRTDEALDVMSVTKMFTAALVLRAADAGLVELDAPVVGLDAYPGFPYAGLVTPRQLLAHRSGIPNYWDSPRYVLDPLSVGSPVDGIAAAAELPLRYEPGTRSEYSSTNYLILGLLLEQVTGRGFDELLRDELLDPLGLTETSHLPSEPGHPRGATGGATATLADLGRAGMALLRDRVSAGGEALARSTQIDDATGIGVGINGYCPCTPAPEGGLRYFALGHTGGHTLVLYLPDHDAVVTLDVTGTFWVNRVFEEVIGLVQRLADRATGRAVPEPVLTADTT